MKFVHDSAIEGCGERTRIPIKVAIYISKLFSTDQLSRGEKIRTKKIFSQHFSKNILCLGKTQ